MKLSEEATTALVSLAQHAYKTGQYEEALPLFRLLTMRDPENRPHWMGLGATLQMLKQYYAAVTVYGYAAVLSADDPYVHLHAAECYHSVAEDDKALIALDAAITTAEEFSQHNSLLEPLKLLRQRWEGEEKDGSV